MNIKYSDVVRVEAVRHLLDGHDAGRLIVMDERIDELLGDIEAMHGSQERHARRGEYAEEFAAQAAERTWSSRLRGTLGHRVRVVVGEREISGTTTFVGEGVIVIRGFGVAVVMTRAIAELWSDAHAHSETVSAVERLGLGSALRRWSALRAEVEVVRAGGASTIRGRISMVASDYVEIAGRAVPFVIICAVRAASDPFAS